MAYASKLPEAKFDAIYDKLQALAKAALENDTSVTVGFFPNPWVKVLNLWTVDRLSNIEVYDMLKTEQVSLHIELMPFEDTLKRQAPVVIT